AAGVSSRCPVTAFPSNATQLVAVPLDSNADSRSETDRKPFRSASAGPTIVARLTRRPTFLREDKLIPREGARPSRARWLLQNLLHWRPKATASGQIEHGLRHVPNSGPARKGCPRPGLEDLPGSDLQEQRQQTANWRRRRHRNCQAPMCLCFF